MINYEGIFFDGDDLDIILSMEKEKLDYINDVIHCTFKYKPSEEEIFDGLVGKRFYIDLIGYGCDGLNSGFIINIPEELKKYYINYDENNSLVIPHITCSVMKNAEPNNTKDLVFEMFDKPVRVCGVFGYYIKDKNGKAYVSYTPFKK